MSGKSQKPTECVICLDETGHLSNIPCTWAPSNTPITEAMPNQASMYIGTFVTSINSISSIHDGKSETNSPVTEKFPPLYSLPRRSTHNYECETKKHHGTDTCHCDPTPLTAASRRHTMSDSGDAQRPRLNTESHSWTMEDQRRLQHAKMIYDDDRRPYSWEEL